MSPPRQRLSAEDRRESILEAVTPLVAARGYDAVTTRELAQAANVSEALLYRHFSSKQELFDAIKDVCIARTRETARLLESMPSDTGTLVAALYVLMRKVRFGRLISRDSSSMTRLMLHSLLQEGVFAREFLAGSAGVWVPKLEACIQAAIAAGDLVATFDEGKMGIWLAHHVAVSLNLFQLPPQPVLHYPFTESHEQLDVAVKFSLRGIGFTAEAIERYYRPDVFRVLVGDPAT